MFGLKVFGFVLGAAAIGFMVAWSIRAIRIREMYQSIRSLESDAARLASDARAAERRARANRVAREGSDLALARARAELSAQAIEIDQAGKRAAALAQRAAVLESDRHRLGLIADSHKAAASRAGARLLDLERGLDELRVHVDRHREQLRLRNAQLQRQREQVASQAAALQAVARLRAGFLELEQQAAAQNEAHEQCVRSLTDQIAGLDRALRASQGERDRSLAEMARIENERDELRAELAAQASNHRAWLRESQALKASLAREQARAEQRAADLQAAKEHVSAHNEQQEQHGASAHTDDRLAEQPARVSMPQGSAADGVGDDSGELPARPPRQYLRAPEQIDELRKVHGIGHRVQPLLYSIGVYQFRQIAAWDRDDIDYFDRLLKLHGRIRRERWIETAAQAHRDKYGETLPWPRGD